MEKRDIPNLITLLRMVLVIPILWQLANGHYLESLLLFAVAGLSDGVDGLLAKRMGWQSRLGSILDPLADKLLLVTVTAMLTWVELVPLWLTIVIIVRDLLIVGGALYYHYQISRFELAPSIVSKINTFSQISYLLAVILDAALQTGMGHELEMATYVVLTTTLLSGADYLWTWGWSGWQSYRQERKS